MILGLHRYTQERRGSKCLEYFCYLVALTFYSEIHCDSVLYSIMELELFIRPHYIHIMQIRESFKSSNGRLLWSLLVSFYSKPIK